MIDNNQQYLRHEFEQCQSLDSDKLALQLTGQDPTQWLLILKGPAGTVYVNGIFYVEIKFPNEYPYLPPRIRFITKIYHPNININGNVSLTTLKSGWTTKTSMKQVICEIQNLLTEPNLNNILVPKIGQEYQENFKQFEEIAQQWTNKFAKDQG